MSNTFLIWNLVVEVQMQCVQLWVFAQSRPSGGPIARFSGAQNKCLPQIICQKHLSIHSFSNILRYFNGTPKFPKTPLMALRLPWDVSCEALKSTEFMKNAAANRHVQVPHVNCSFHMAMFHGVVKGCSNWRNLFFSTSNKEKSLPGNNKDVKSVFKHKSTIRATIKSRDMFPHGRFQMLNLYELPLKKKQETSRLKE